MTSFYKKCITVRMKSRCGYFACTRVYRISSLMITYNKKNLYIQRNFYNSAIMDIE